MNDEFIHIDRITRRAVLSSNSWLTELRARRDDAGSMTLDGEALPPAILEARSIDPWR
jgi:hypothetical protein